MTLNAVPWAPGTIVTAYDRKTPAPYPDMPPPGQPLVGQATVLDDRSLSFGVPPGDYWAVAPLTPGGRDYRYVGFIEPVPPPLYIVGPQGPVGPQGTVGPAGPQGVAGPQGPQGDATGLRRMRAGGRWYTASGSQATRVPSNGELTAHPIRVEAGQGLDAMGVNIAGAGEAGALVRLGIYADNGDGYPGALLADLGTVPGDATNPNAQVSIIPTLVPTGPLLWLAAIVYAAPASRPSVMAFTAANPASPEELYSNVPLGLLGAGGSANGWGRFGQTTGVLPATFPTDAQASLNSTPIKLAVRTAA